MAIDPRAQLSKADRSTVACLLDGRVLAGADEAAIIHSLLLGKSDWKTSECLLSRVLRGCPGYDGRGEPAPKLGRREEQRNW